MQQVIDSASEVTKQEIPVNLESRRIGDPAVLIADATRAKLMLGWEPKHSNLEKIIKTAWDWEQTFFAH